MLCIYSIIVRHICKFVVLCYRLNAVDKELTFIAFLAGNSSSLLVRGWMMVFSMYKNRPWPIFILMERNLRI